MAGALMMVVAGFPASPASAQQLELAGGLAVPFGRLADDADPGIAVTVGARTDVASRLAFRLLGHGDFFRDFPEIRALRLLAGPDARVTSPGAAGGWTLSLGAVAGVVFYTHPTVVRIIGAPPGLPERLETAPTAGLDVSAARRLSPKTTLVANARWLVAFTSGERLEGTDGVTPAYGRLGSLAITVGARIRP